MGGGYLLSAISGKEILLIIHDFIVVIVSQIYYLNVTTIKKEVLNEFQQA